MLPHVLTALSAALLVSAKIYVIHPFSGSTCHGGQPCTVTWIDDGDAPLLPKIGVTRVGVYTDTLKLIQNIEPVDVSASHSLTFTPDPKAGPNSNAYYIVFTPVNDIGYRGYSPWFSLDDMTGSFNSPDPSATASIPIPPSLTGGSTSTAATTSTTGATSTTTAPSTTTVPSTTGSTSTLATVSSSGSTSATGTGNVTSSSTTGSAKSSGFSTVFSSGSSTGSHVASSTTATPSNAAVANIVTSTGFMWTLIASCVGSILF